jgi:hypothetical protein
MELILTKVLSMQKGGRRAVYNNNIQDQVKIVGKTFRKVPTYCQSTFLTQRPFVMRKRLHIFYIKIFPTHFLCVKWYLLACFKFQVCIFEQTNKKKQTMSKSFGKAFVALLSIVKTAIVLLIEIHIKTIQTSIQWFSDKFICEIRRNSPARAWQPGNRARIPPPLPRETRSNGVRFVNTTLNYIDLVRRSIHMEDVRDRLKVR